MIEVEDWRLDRQLAWLIRSRGMVVTNSCQGNLELDRNCKQDFYITGACQS